MSIEFKLLGTGAGPGVPSFFCDCIACQEAKDNPRLARTRSGAIVSTGKEVILVDTSPDLRNQLIRENIKEIDNIFISHWHYDHFGGLGDLEFYVKLNRQRPLKLFLPPNSVGEFESAFPFLTDVFEVVTWEYEKSYDFQNLTITPLPATHSIQTAGFLLEAEKKIAYFTDTAGLASTTIGKIEEVDYFICDATFHGENWYPHSHMSIDQAVALGSEIKAKHTVLTHLAMHYSQPVTVEYLDCKLKGIPEVSLAYDGMIIHI